MNEYNDYVSAVNKIFDYINKMRTGWDSQDNISHIENIEEYKQVVVANVETFKKPAPMPAPVEESAEPQEQQPQEESNNNEIPPESLTESLPEM